MYLDFDSLFLLLCTGGLLLVPLALSLWWLRRDGNELRGEVDGLRRAQRGLSDRLELLESRDRLGVSTPGRKPSAGAVPAGSTDSALRQPRPRAAADAPARPPLSPPASRPTVKRPSPVEPSTMPTAAAAATKAPPGLPPSPPRSKPAAPSRKPPPRQPSLEESLGARLPVWLGSIALALAGVYLVRYSIEQGWITETTRVVLGTLFGAGLLAGGELIGRKAERIAEALSAAGIAVLYAAFLAASEVYGLISSELGFGLTALVTAAAVMLSLRRGPIVALVGLIGGFLTPRMLRGDPNPSPAPMLAYLLLLQAGLVMVARRRNWWWLAVATLVSALWWVLPWLPGVSALAAAPWLYAYLLASLAVFATSAFNAEADAPPEGAEPTGPTLAIGLGEHQQEVPLSRVLAWAAMAGVVGLASMIADASGYTFLDWAFMGLIGIAAIILGRRMPDSEGLPWVAALVVGIALANWGSGGALSDFGRGDLPDVNTYVGTTALFGLVFAVGGYIAMWGARRTWPWAALTAASAVGFLLLAGFNSWDRIEQGPLGIPWGAWILLVGALLTAAAVPVARRRALAEGGSGEEHASPWNQPLAALAAGATTCAALAVPAELERQWITVAWALQVAALAWLARRLKVPALRALIWPIAALVSVRLLVNPAVVWDYPIGEAPIFNWLLYGYGLPILAFVFAAREARLASAKDMARALESLAVLFGLALLSLQVMHVFGRGDLDHDWPWLELAVMPVAWTLYGMALRLLDRRVPRSTLRWGGLAIALIGLAGAVLLQLGPLNPTWFSAEVGSTRVFNALLISVGAPALLALALARDLASGEDFRGRKEWLTILGIAVIGLGFLLVNLEVRQAFRGSNLSLGSMSAAENYSYSAAWLVYGMTLLAIGIVRRNLLARRASLAVFILAVGKVFLFDTSQLNDLYRVLSFLGLGASLLLLAWVYQRFVFREET